MHVSKVDSPCVLWAHACMPNGYGQTYHRGKVVSAHRLAYAEAHMLDVFSMGGVVLHSCDVRTCVNPEHLTHGTQADNVADMIRKGRQAPCRGAEQGQSKRTAEIVRECRFKYKPRCATYGTKALALLYGVSQATMSSAISGRSWAHLA